MPTPADVPTVREFIASYYAALGDGRGDDVAAMTRERFAAGASLRRPESLPGGGTIEGADRIARFMQRAAGAVADLTVRSINADTEGDSIDVFVELELSLGSPTRAIEHWVVRPDGVASVTAFYWDTAATLAALNG